MTFKVEIEQPVHCARVHIWVYDLQDAGAWVMRPVEAIFEKICGPEEVVPKPAPTLDLSWSVWARLLQAVPEAVTGTGVETRAVANAAELRATKGHLEDMRRLAFAAHDPRREGV